MNIYKKRSYFLFISIIITALFSSLYIGLYNIISPLEISRGAFLFVNNLLWAGFYFCMSYLIIKRMIFLNVEIKSFFIFLILASYFTNVEFLLLLEVLFKLGVPKMTFLFSIVVNFILLGFFTFIVLKKPKESKGTVSELSPWN